MTSRRSQTPTGHIREEVCRSHKYVLWDMAYASLPAEDRLLRSPTFKIGANDYILQLVWSDEISCDLKLLCRNLSEIKEIRCFIGVKCGNGAYYHKIETKKIGKKTSIVCTNILDKYILYTVCRDPNRNLSFFVRVNVECAEESLKTCKHGFANIAASGEGSIREEECGVHKQVEWAVAYEFKEDDVVNSREFMIGAQRYLMELGTYCQTVEIRFFRMGPSVEQHVQCISGMKRKDGSYDHRVQSIDIDLSDQCDMWQYVDTIYSVQRNEHQSLLYAVGTTVTFIVRINKERSQAGAEACTHGASLMSPPGEGRIRGEKCSDHSQVEWDLQYELLQKEYYYGVTCPVFEIGGQRYLMELVYCNTCVLLNLFTPGRTSKNHERYFLGVKRRDGSYDHRIQSGVLDNLEDWDIWQLADGTLHVDRIDLESSLLSSDGFVTFFLRMDVDQTRSGLETCCHDMSQRGVGSVTEMESAIYKQVDWSVNYEPSSRTVTSPSFSVEHQNYLWELSCDDENNRLLKIFRMGPSVNKSVRWWSSVIRNYGSYEQYGSKREELDLEDKTCALWQPVGFPLRITVHVDGKEPLIVSVLMSLEREPIAMNESTSADCQSRQDLNPLLEEDVVVFIVDDKEYKIHKAVLGIRVAVFKAMFSNDFVESQTRVGRTAILTCHIRDCDPDVFEVFLDFIYNGKKEIVTSKNCFALYSVAHKYMFNELKDLCLLKIKKVIVSKENFFDFVNFSLIYEDDDVLKKATRFFSKNKSIIKTRTWQDFYRRNRDAAKHLLTKSFLPFVRY